MSRFSIRPREPQETVWQAHVSVDHETALRRLQAAIDERPLLKRQFEPSGRPFLGELRGDEFRVRLAQPSMGGHSLEPTLVGRIVPQASGVSIAGRFTCSTAFRNLAVVALSAIMIPVVGNVLQLVSGEPSHLLRSLAMASVVAVVIMAFTVFLRRLGRRDMDHLWSLMLERLNPP